MAADRTRGGQGRPPRAELQRLEAFLGSRGVRRQERDAVLGGQEEMPSRRELAERLKAWLRGRPRRPPGTGGSAAGGPVG